MATTRNRRTGVNPANYAVDEDGDRVYTEDDYAASLTEEELPDEWETGKGSYAATGWTGEEYLPDEAFTPDEEDLSAEGTWEDDPDDDYVPGPLEADYIPLFEGEADFDDDLDPLDDELLTDAERAELRRSHWQLISGLADFAGVILGTAAILVLVTLLVSLINWLINDMSQSFILLQKNL